MKKNNRQKTLLRETKNSLSILLCLILFRIEGSFLPEKINMKDIEEQYKLKINELNTLYSELPKPYDVDKVINFFCKKVQLNFSLSYGKNNNELKDISVLSCFNVGCKAYIIPVEQKFFLRLAMYKEYLKDPLSFNFFHMRYILLMYFEKNSINNNIKKSQFIDFFKNDNFLKNLKNTQKDIPIKVINIKSFLATL